MGHTLYLFYGFSITWVILFLYLFGILKRQRSLERELDRIESILERR